MQHTASHPRETASPSDGALVSPGHEPLHGVYQQVHETALEQEGELDRARIRNKQSPGPMANPVVESNLKAAALAIDMASIDALQRSERRPRSPAPLPPSTGDGELLRPFTSPPLSKSPLRQTLASPRPEGEHTLDLNTLHDLDLTAEGKRPAEYTRNRLATGIVAVLLVVGVELFVEHCFMFTWVVRFNTPETVVAAVLYVISTLCVLFTLASALLRPSYSLAVGGQLAKLYSPLVVAGVFDLVAVLVGGSIFSPFILYTLDFGWYVSLNHLAVVLTLLLNSLLYFAFTRPQNTKMSDLFHPFRAHGGIEGGEESDGGSLAAV